MGWALGTSFCFPRVWPWESSMISPFPTSFVPHSLGASSSPIRNSAAPTLLSSSQPFSSRAVPPSHFPVRPRLLLRSCLPPPPANPYFSLSLFLYFTSLITISGHRAEPPQTPPSAAAAPIPTGLAPQVRTLNLMFWFFLVVFIQGLPWTSSCQWGPDEMGWKWLRGSCHLGNGNRIMNANSLWK